MLSCLEVPFEIWEMVIRFASGSLEDVCYLRLLSHRFKQSVYQLTVGLILQEGEGCFTDASNQSDFSKLSDTSLLRIAETFPALQSLTMQHALSVTAEGFGVALKRLRAPALKHVDLSGCMNLTDSSIKSVVSACPDLQSLDISGCGRLSELSLKRIANGCSKIQLLWLGCTNDSWDFFGDRGMRHLAGCKLLHHLDLSHNNGVTIRGIKNLANLPNLKHLVLAGCSSIDDACLAEISAIDRGFTSLQMLDISNCFLVSKLAVDFLVAKPGRPAFKVKSTVTDASSNGVVAPPTVQ